MNKLILCFSLVLSFFSVSLYATDLSVKLNKLSKQLDRAELYAVNCDMDSQVDKKNSRNMYSSQYSVAASDR